jgi:hypothetical protein
MLNVKCFTLVHEIALVTGFYQLQSFVQATIFVLLIKDVKCVSRCGGISWSVPNMFLVAEGYVSAILSHISAVASVAK